MQIKDHAFLVTGGGSGLGAACAAMLIAAGGKVVVADVNAPKDPGAARFIKADVTDEASMQAAVDHCVATFGAIHGLVNRSSIFSRLR